MHAEASSSDSTTKPLGPARLERGRVVRQVRMQVQYVKPRLQYVNPRGQLVYFHAGVRQLASHK
jgi:hypothetical protein